VLRIVKSGRCKYVNPITYEKYNHLWNEEQKEMVMRHVVIEDINNVDNFKLSRQDVYNVIENDVNTDIESKKELHDTLINYINIFEMKDDNCIEFLDRNNRDINDMINSVDKILYLKNLKFIHKMSKINYGFKQALTRKRFIWFDYRIKQTERQIKFE
jgi:hypothetical protein